jgi:hypothetical protein
LAFGFAEQMACSLYAEPTLEQALDRLRNRPVFLVSARPSGRIPAWRRVSPSARGTRP